MRIRLKAVATVLAVMLAMVFGTAQARAELLIITEISPPHAFTSDGTEFGALSGRSVDIVKEIQKRVGDTSPIRVMPWSRAWYMSQNAPGTVIFNTVRTPEREHLLRWVGPISTNTWVFFARKDGAKKLGSLEEALRAGRIAVYQDDAREHFLKKNGFQNLDVVNSPELALRKLLSGRVDLWASDVLEGEELSREIGEDPNRIQAVYDIRKADAYCAFSRDVSAETVAAWQKALDSMKADGTYQKIVDDWAAKWPTLRAKLPRK